MSDWSGYPFLVLWAVIAVFVGLLFAISPNQMESMNRRSVNRTRLTKRIADRHAPRDGVVKFYRVGGIVFAVLGVVGLVVGLVGTIGFATGIFN